MRETDWVGKNFAKYGADAVDDPAARIASVGASFRAVESALGRGLDPGAGQ